MQKKPNICAATMSFFTLFLCYYMTMQSRLSNERLYLTRESIRVDFTVSRVYKKCIVYIFVRYYFDIWRYALSLH